MEMRILCELSRKLLNEGSLRDRWGEQNWSEAFHACGSPTEWREFAQRRSGESFLSELRTSYEAIARAVLQSRADPPRQKKSVSLPEF